MASKENIVKKLEKEFAREFPNMKDQVVFLDPADYKNSRRMMFAIEDHYIEFERARLPKGTDQAIIDKATGRALQQAGSLIAFVEAGMPAAAPIGVQITPEKISRHKTLVFGGKNEISGNDIMWRMMAGVIGNTVASLSSKVEKRLKRELGERCALPKSMEDNEMLQTFFIDHEVGHAITMNKLQGQVISTHDFAQYFECVADSYALIRHYQRFGDDTNMPDDWMALRDAAAVIGQDIIHWTTPALKDVQQMNKDGLIKNLTPHQAMDLAIKMGEKHGFTLDQAENVKSAFKGSVLGDTLKGTAGDLVKGKLNQMFNKKAEQQQVSPEVVIMENLQNNILKAIDNKQDTVENILKTAQGTKSQAVFEVAKSFLLTVENIFPDIKGEGLNAAKQTVSQMQGPQTEPTRSVIKQKMHSARWEIAKKMYGRK